jgi:hypothetical protein
MYFCDTNIKKATLQYFIFLLLFYNVSLNENSAKQIKIFNLFRKCDTQEH